MDIRMFYILLIEIVILTVVVAGLILVINFVENEKCPCTCGDGAEMKQSFEFYDDSLIPQQISARISEKYDDKYFEYMEHIKERRDATFLR
jgi:hypothetical protein